MIRKHIGSRRVFGVQDKLVECVLGDGLPIYRNSTSYTLSELKNKGNRNYEGVEGDHLGTIKSGRETHRDHRTSRLKAKEDNAL